MASSGTPQSAIRLTVLNVKLPSLSEEEFFKYWQEVHAPVFLNLPVVKEKLLKYEQFHIKHDIPHNLPIPNASFDGEANMWFRTLEDMQAVLSDPDYREKVVGDAVNFLVLEETRMLIGYDVDFKW